jgi:hypothetical protein
VCGKGAIDNEDVSLVPVLLEISKIQNLALLAAYRLIEVRRELCVLQSAQVKFEKAKPLIGGGRVEACDS